MTPPGERPDPLAGDGRIHFVGIGGAGMSAIAKVLLERGRQVSGSDLKRSNTTGLLEAIGASVTIGHEASVVDGASLVVISAAIPDSNPELSRARELGIEVITRGRALAHALRGQRSIYVGGTHGKTTTTSMIVSVLRDAGLDPTYLIGGGLNDSGTNARQGTGDLAVAESDESDGSFLFLDPDIAVVTNVEIDHVDHWHSIEELRAAFVSWMERVAADGTIVVPIDDEALVAAARSTGRAVVTFGEGGDVTAAGVTLAVPGATFSLEVASSSAEVKLRVPGAHNVDNALAAAAAAVAAGVGVEEIARGLSAYRGVERRFQMKGEAGGVTVIDDYAHHPTEIKATLSAARPGPWRRVVAVFQPHRYSRTAALADAFGASFEDADRIVVTDVYGAGESPVPGVTGKSVSDAVATAFKGRPVAYLPHRHELVPYLATMLRPGDAVLTLGAGDISGIGDELLDALREEEP